MQAYLEEKFDELKSFHVEHRAKIEADGRVYISDDTMKRIEKNLAETMNAITETLKSEFSLYTNEESVIGEVETMKLKNLFKYTDGIMEFLAQTKFPFFAVQRPSSEELWRLIVDKTTVVGNIMVKKWHTQARSNGVTDVGELIFFSKYPVLPF
jgi:hypothetical protein